MASSPTLAQEEPQPTGKQLRNQLAIATRSINWNYAMFCSISSSNPGVLTWKDGFYNGEVKTRKIVANSAELPANQVVMQRSEKLRELYESLLSGKCDRRAARPVASLSPEDLGDTEWYYVVCMTYAFRPGQGLPGRSFVSNEHVWLCNAHLADSKTFPRALLAKSAAIQVPENTELVNQITTFFKDLQYPACMYVPSTNVTGQAENVIVLLDDLDENATAMISEDRHEFGEIDHLFNTNTNLEQITEIEDFYGLWEELDVQPLESSWVMDGPSMVAAPEAAKHAATQSAPTESSRMTSFVAWMTPSSGELAALAVPIIGEPQNLLKKVVTGGAWMNNGDERTGRRIAKESGIKNHVKSERRRREKLNEMLLILKSLIPTIRKMDKASILAETIAYLKQLEQKVQELESSRGAISSPAGETMLRCHDNEIGKRASAAKKRKKASKLSGNMEEEHHWVLSEDSASNVIIVSIIGARVIVQVQCRWKELLMARVFETIKNLDLDILSVQASTPDGLLGLKIQAQFVGSATFAPGMIRESLQKAIGKS